MIENVIFVGSMSEPGGGKTFISPRILRHMNLISIAQFDDETLNRIFQSILDWFFTNNGFGVELHGEVIKSTNKLVYGTLDIYTKVMEKLLPTPSKSHYLFNLRDFSKVILGITMSDKENLKT